MTRRTAIFAPAICLLCSGCGRAPSVDIIGSFFPVWMVCLAIAVVILLSCSLWLIFFR